MPSNIDSISPGASSTESGAFVDSTGSPRPRPEARRLFVNLDRGHIAAKFDYFSDQAFIAHAHDVVHLRIRHILCHYQRPGYFDYGTLHGHQPYLLKFITFIDY